MDSSSPQKRQGWAILRSAVGGVKLQSHPISRRVSAHSVLTPSLGLKRKEPLKGVYGQAAGAPMGIAVALSFCLDCRDTGGRATQEQLPKAGRSKTSFRKNSDSPPCSILTSCSLLHLRASDLLIKVLLMFLPSLRTCTWYLPSLLRTVALHYSHCDKWSCEWTKILVCSLRNIENLWCRGEDLNLHELSPTST